MEADGIQRLNGCDSVFFPKGPDNMGRMKVEQLRKHFQTDILRIVFTKVFHNIFCQPGFSAGLLMQLQHIQQLQHQLLGHNC